MFLSFLCISSLWCVGNFWNSNTLNLLCVRSTVRVDNWVFVSSSKYVSGVPRSTVYVSRFLSVTCIEFCHGPP